MLTYKIYSYGNDQFSPVGGVLEWQHDSMTCQIRVKYEETCAGTAFCEILSFLGSQIGIGL